MRLSTPALGLALLLALTPPPSAHAGDSPQWGTAQTRNMASTETGLPVKFDLATGENVLWTAPLGSDSYGTPAVASGKVIVGANNRKPRDPRIQGDYAVLLCLNEADGALCWQLAVPRIGGDNYLDWPRIGMCSPATVEGGRVYTVTNRYEVVCLDLDGQADGNDGPYQDEGKHMAADGAQPLEVTATDADIVWLFDMRTGVGMYPHDSAHASVLLDGPYLYLNTCNGVDNTHRVIRRPDAPSLIVLEKETGRLVAQDGERIGPRIFHSTWSSPAMGTVNGRKLVFFCGGAGVTYAFEALDPEKIPTEVQTLKRVWRFDPDPAAPKENVAEYLENRKESPTSVSSMPVFHNNRIYVTVGGDIWWGKRQASLRCIDATQSGDVTESAQLWSYPLERHCSSTPAIADGLLFVADCGGKVHCVDAETGARYWVHDAGREIWGSTLVADGKVYVGTRGRRLCVLEASRGLKPLAEIELDAVMCTTPVAANGVLYVSTLEHIHAIRAPAPQQ